MSLVMDMLCHFPSSAQVLVFSWVSVLAVTTPRVSGLVSTAHLISQRPRRTCQRRGGCGGFLNGPIEIDRPSRTRVRTSFCQASGPDSSQAWSLERAKESSHDISEGIA